MEGEDFTSEEVVAGCEAGHGEGPEAFVGDQGWTGELVLCDMGREEGLTVNTPPSGARVETFLSDLEPFEA